MAAGSKNCPISGESLSAYIDGMLDGNAIRQVANHLQECAICRQQAYELQQTKQILKNYQAPNVAPGADFWSNAYRQARLAVPATRTPNSWSNRTFGVGKLVAAVVSACLVCIVVLLLPQTQQSSVVTSGSDAGALNVSSLVRSHAEYETQQPLTDSAHLSMILSDAANQVTSPQDDTASESLISDTSDVAPGGSVSPNATSIGD